MIGSVSLVTAFALAACGTGEEDSMPDQDMDSGEDNSMDEDMHEDMDHSSSGEVPDDLEEEENPSFEEGSQATVEGGHMEEMEGAEATIVGAYNTTAYIVSYTPTNGGERVENHEWVVHEEIEDVGEETLEPGTEVTLDADHMDGMEGATAEIDEAEETTVYMIDYTPTTGGEEVENHKWVTEDELSNIE
ncbi:YdhK family protein [Natribacillus halophilus]|nr:YdhK family protein [Natribacillus halophilus]